MVLATTRKLPVRGALLIDQIYKMLFDGVILVSCFNNILNLISGMWRSVIRSPEISNSINRMLFVRWQLVITSHCSTNSYILQVWYRYSIILLCANLSLIKSIMYSLLCVLYFQPCDTLRDLHCCLRRMSPFMGLPNKNFFGPLLEICLSL